MSTLTNPPILDEYGNNAAVRCPSCNGVFVFSKHVNKINGRECPHCHQSIAINSEDGIRVELMQSPA